ncbi:MAG: 7-carboxy-7-deazaguanine synthase [Gemmatimonadales bacterium]
MSYAVKEIYYTLQGEGAQTGRPAVFCRFAGCNLWSGREADRPSAICRFCDTDFVGTDGPGGGRFPAATALADAVAAQWPESAPGSTRYVVLTGGEPLLQVDADLIAALHGRAFEIGIETNGTLPVPAGIDWVCVSPKAEADLVVQQGDELKLVYPQAGAAPERYAGLGFRHRFLQPLDGPDRRAATTAAIEYCLTHPEWRLSLQTHKLLGLK